MLWHKDSEKIVERTPTNVCTQLITLLYTTDTTAAAGYVRKHCIVRMNDDRLPKVIFYGELQQGTRSCGGQKKRFKDCLKASLKIYNIEPDEPEDLAADRSGWRSLCKDSVHQFEANRVQCLQAKRAQPKSADRRLTAQTLSATSVGGYVRQGSDCMHTAAQVICDQRSVERSTAQSHTAAAAADDDDDDANTQPLLEQLHWLPVRQRIDYKLAVLTYKIRHTSTPAIPQLPHQTSGIYTPPPFFNHTAAA